jgi:hypothetical protein
LSEQTDGVLEWLRLLPFAVFLAIVVPYDYTLVPGEEVLETLLSSGNNTLSQRIGWAIGAFHIVEVPGD